jgi:methylmalonyl-CoA mutase
VSHAIRSEQSLQPAYPIRFVTAASLFDGHDAAINIIRRILQDQGCEVIHLGHNRSVSEIVRAIIQEDADGVAISSYQGGHNEFFKYLIDSLKAEGFGHVRVFGGGGGVILPREKKDLEAYGVDKIFLPEDGMKYGLEGMIRLMIESCVKVRESRPAPVLNFDHPKLWGQTLTQLERSTSLPNLPKSKKQPVVVGVTGTGGAGKSSLVDELILRFLYEHPGLKMAIYSVDPTKKRTGGALLGDRIRMNAIEDDRVFMRSLATRGSGSEIADSVQRIVQASRASDFDVIIVETSGIGQSGSAITQFADLSLYVMTSDYGAATQLEKIDMIDFADLIAVNKFERRGSEDALQAVRKQYQRSRKLFNLQDLSELPIVGTRCNIFNDPGVTKLYHLLKTKLREKNSQLPEANKNFDTSGKIQSVIIPPDRVFYLGEIAKVCKDYRRLAHQEIAQARKAYVLKEAAQWLPDAKTQAQAEWEALSSGSKEVLERWSQLASEYQNEKVRYRVRDKEILAPQIFKSLSGSLLKRVAAPKLESWDLILKFSYFENLPGYFPFTAGIYPFKRQGEEPRRQFAGEGPPARTNARFHYLCRHDQAKRLSTAFDSVTLYGEDPALRPDIYGKVGESGVSIATLEDMEVLYKDFDLCDPNTSVSMTINGPAPILLAMFMNTAINQQLQRFKEKNRREPHAEERLEIEKQTLANVRGTVQADILKEDQAQNTCIFSTEFALKMMGDIQEYFIQNKVRNYYSVSISGYHIAEAGANPVTQLAFTLANGFTLVEYYLSRGMKIDEFAPNLSFFFSNGLDPEYSVLGRVARRIWSVVMRDRYGANERSQKLKYHIQTSGRSLHAQEIEFNDIRTTLQALTAIYDNCNSLHTNAYDEAITTPTEESVRRAMAIQMIIEREYGSAKTENFLQGSYAMEELTDLVEEAVLAEFERISSRGGVLGAMEMQYQRAKIQEESLHYEHLKHSGELPIVGVNTFQSEQSQSIENIEISRSNPEEKNQRLEDLKKFWAKHAQESSHALQSLKATAISGGNIFEELMKAVRSCSLGQISQALYEVGGKYRRNM